MAKIDCSNIFNFISEWERRNKAKDSALSVNDMGYNLYTSDRWNTSLEEGLKKWVDDLQKWSDEHPKNTRKEKFIEMCMENGFAKITESFCADGLPYGICCKASCDECNRYWNEVVE